MNYSNGYSPYCLPTPYFQPIIPVADSNSGNFPYKEGEHVYVIQQRNGISAVTPTTYMRLKKVNSDEISKSEIVEEQKQDEKVEDKQPESSCEEKEKKSEEIPTELPELTDKPSEPIKLKLPKCSRCHTEFVNIKNGRRMKTCKECLSKSKYNQRRSLKLKEFFTNSVMCSTCNRNIAMMKGNKQLHTCEACIMKKKVKYEKQRKIIKEKEKQKPKSIADFEYDYVNSIDAAFSSHKV